MECGWGLITGMFYSSGIGELGVGFNKSNVSGKGIQHSKR